MSQKPLARMLKSSFELPTGNKLVKFIRNRQNVAKLKPNIINPASIIIMNPHLFVLISSHQNLGLIARFVLAGI